MSRQELVLRTWSTTYNTLFVSVLAAAVVPYVLFSSNVILIPRSIVMSLVVPGPRASLSLAEPIHTLATLEISCWLTINMGGVQSTPKITAQDRAILEYASHPALPYAVLK